MAKSVRYQIMVPEHLDKGIKEITETTKQPTRDYLLDLLRTDQQRRKVGVYRDGVKN